MPLEGSLKILAWAVPGSLNTLVVFLDLRLEDKGFLELENFYTT